MSDEVSQSAPESVAHHAVATLRLGIPLIGGNLAQIAVQVTDTLMLGWYDVDALAAVALGGAWFFTLLIMGAGFAFAIMPMIAAEDAAGDRTQVRRITRMGLWLSAIFSACAMPFLIWGGPILRAMGQPEVIADGAHAWLSIAGWGLFPGLAMFVLRGYLAALGRTQVTFWALVIAAVANAILDYGLIFGNFGLPELGIRGAGIASFTTFLISALALALYAVRVLPEHQLFVRFWRPDWPVFGRVFRLGWPIGLTNLSEVGLFAAASLMMGWIGTVELAAHGIALQISSVTFLIHVGLSNAATIRIGAAFGHKDRAGVRRAAAAAMCLSMMLVLMTITLFISFPEMLVALFIDPRDPDAAAVMIVAMWFVTLAALFQAADAGQAMALGFLRGVQDTRVPMVLAALSYWGIGMSCSYVFAFPLGMSATGVWVGLTLGLSVAAALLMWRFWKRA